MEHNRILITVNDYQRLTGLIEFGSLTTKTPRIVNRLIEKFKSAKMLAQDRISAAVITMNSRVLVKEIGQDRQAAITVTYPHDADPREGKVSVLSSIGLALLGRQVGDQVSWVTPVGTGDFEITKIIYQPESMGHYHL
jgi:regulator of nucleoside diphosphate kinase